MRVTDMTATAMSGQTARQDEATTQPQERGSERVSRVVTLAPFILVCIAPLLMLRVALRPVSDPDTFWHIRAGEYISSTWRFSGAEPWSAFSSNEWVLHEWLPQLALYAAWDIGGLPGVAWVNAVAAALMLPLLYVTCRRFATTLPAALAAMVAWVGASGSFSPRPQMVTFALVLVCTAAWLRTSSDRQPRWWLIPLTWVWACSHGMWFIGVIVALAVLAGMIMDRSITRSQAGRLALVPALSVLAAALTPVGPSLFLAPLHVGDYTKYVAEWAAPSLRDHAMAMTVVVVVLIITTWSRRKERTPWPHVLLLVAALGLTLLYDRTVAVGAVMLAPIFAMTLQSVLPRRSPPPRKAEMLGLASSAIVVAAVSAMVAPQVAASAGRVPTAFDHRLASLSPGTVVYDEYELGGWLLLHHPHVEPVIDPRTEVFSVDYVAEYMASRIAAPGWRDTVRASRAQVAILPVSSPLAGELVHEGWHELQTDRGFAYLTAP